MANSAGGVLVIGVEDRTRNVKGVAAPLDVQERLAKVVATGIPPPLMPAIEIWPWRDKEAIVVEVFSSSSPPHQVNAEGVEREAYVRVGASNRLADEALREELKRTARNESYDELPVPTLSSEAIDFSAASELFAPVRKLKREDLESLHPLTRHQRRLVPTNGGVLLFGVRRAATFPDAWVRVGRFSGTTRTHILDTAEIHDPRRRPRFRIRLGADRQAQPFLRPKEMLPGRWRKRCIQPPHRRSPRRRTQSCGEFGDCCASYLTPT